MIDTKRLFFFEFETKMKKYDGSIVSVKDFCTHYSLEEAIKSVKEYNKDRGFQVVKIIPLLIKPIIRSAS